MRIRRADVVEKGLRLLGTEESCVYLLEGTRSSALISAGLSYILPDLLQQIDLIGVPDSKIEHIIILHAHFDHVGIVPYLKRKWPHVTVYASTRGWEVLSNPKAISVIHDFTLKVCTRMRGNTNMLTSFDWQWRNDVNGQVLRQGSSIDLGGTRIEILETPGHSSCSISAYVPRIKALFPSDAVAIPYRDEYVIAVGSSFAAYQKSLDKLMALDVETICADHYGYIVGSEAKNYIKESKTAAYQMVDRLHQALREEENVERAASKLVDLHFAKRPDYFVHPEILLRTYTQMLKQLEIEPP